MTIKYSKKKNLDANIYKTVNLINTFDSNKLVQKKKHFRRKSTLSHSDVTLEFIHLQALTFDPDL